MELVKVDSKGRIQIPKKFRAAMRLKPKSTILMGMSSGRLFLERAASISEENDPVLNDMVNHPLRSKVRVTKELLEKLKDEDWTA